MFGSIWVAPVTVFVRSTPCWLGAAFGGANAPLGTATPCTSRPTAKVMFPCGPAACRSASNGLISRSVTPRTRELPPPPTSSVRAVVPITASERRSACSNGNVLPWLRSSTAPCSAIVRACWASASSGNGGSGRFTTVPPVGDAWTSRPNRSIVVKMLRTALSNADTGTAPLWIRDFSCKKWVPKNSMSIPASSAGPALWFAP